MKKFTFLMIALFIAAMGFAQNRNLTGVYDKSSVTPVFKSQLAKQKANIAKTQRDGQATIALVAGDVWGDGSGYQLLLDADATAYGTILPASGPLTSGGDVSADIYSQFEYKIPENADGALATTNMVNSDSIAITIPAGTYDWCVTNPTEGDRMWIAGNGRADDYTFLAGATYVFRVALEGSGDNVSVEIITTEPIIMVNPSSLSFAAEINTSSAAMEVAVTAQNLTEGITATVAAPFEVSSDNTTFGTTATLTADGGTLYVRFSPTATGDQTGTLTVSSTGAENATVALVAYGYECHAYETPWSETFSNESTSIYCWSVVDANDDGTTFTLVQTDNAGNIAMYLPYAGTQEDYLISPELVIGENMNAKFKVAHYAFQGTPYPETFEVYVIANGSETLVREAAQTSSLMPEWDNVVVDLSAYANQTIKVAIKCISDDAYYFFVDDFSIEAAPTNAEIALTSVAPETGTTVQTGQNINISGVVTNNGVALTSYKVAYTVDNGEAVEYDVTGINVALGETHNFTHATPVVLETAGEHTIVVTVSNPNGSEDGDASDNSMTITINAISCDPITTFPYTEDFENGINQCWTLIDADGDGYNWMHSSERFGETWEGHSGTGALVSASYASAALTPDNWAITPAITLPEGSPASVSFFAAAQDAAYPAEHYGVYVSTTTTDPSAFTLIWEETMDANGGQHRAQGAWGEKHADLSNYAGQTIYIAFRHFNCSDEFVFLIDDVTVALVSAVEENIAESIAVYPNPTSSMVTIANAEGKDIIVVNSLGQVVASIENAAANQTIDVTNFANGTYFVKVDGEVVKLNVVK